MSLPRPRTAAGREGLAALLAQPGRSLVALDYDGTLAPVVDRPEEAVPAPGAVPALERLARRVGRVALVTGRPAAVAVELGGLAGVPGLVVLGQYGVERWSGGRVAAEPPHPGLAAARAALAGLAAASGARVEDKGRSLVLHVRGLADPPAALAALAGDLAELAGRLGLQVHPGRLVLELRPPGFDKGRALRELARPAPSAVLFAGDDVGDLAAFDVVAALRADGVPGVTVCSDSAEGPALLRERADLQVAGPPGVVGLLEGLAAELEA